jgi:AraC-like DNA-binding protein
MVSREPRPIDSRHWRKGSYFGDRACTLDGAMARRPRPPRGDCLAYLRELPVTFVVGFSHFVADGAVHRHDAFELVFHEGRGGVLLGAGGQKAFEGDSITITPPEMDHDQKNDGEGWDHCVQFELRAPVPIPFTRVIHLPRREAMPLLSDIKVLCATSPLRDPLDGMRRDLRTALVLSTVAVYLANQPARGTPDPADRHAELAHAIIAERGPSLSSVRDVARDVGVGYDHLRHVFRQRYGMSLNAWLFAVRMDRARQLLVRSALPIKAIADMAGLGNARHFATRFRDTYGTTPAQFRRASRG